MHIVLSTYIIDDPHDSDYLPCSIEHDNDSMWCHDAEDSLN